MVQENPALRIAEKTNYLNKDISYLKNIQITEYDIKSAGFSVIKFLKLLPSEEIQRLETMPKYERNVAIGLKMKKDPTIAEKIHTTLEKVRKAFVLVNRIEPENILSIKKDALFIIKQQPQTLVIKDYFHFVKKNVYTSYAYLNGKEFYYSSLRSELDIKGLPKEAIEISDIPKKALEKIFEQSEKQTPENLFVLYKNFTKKYLNRELSIENYRELENGKFRYGEYLLNECDEELKSEIDISQNYLKYILPLLQEII